LLVMLPYQPVDRLYGFPSSKIFLGAFSAHFFRNFKSSSFVLRLSGNM